MVLYCRDSERDREQPHSTISQAVQSWALALPIDTVAFCCAVSEAPNISNINPLCFASAASSRFLSLEIQYGPYLYIPDDPQKEPETPEMPPSIL